VRARIALTRALGLRGASALEISDDDDARDLADAFGG
jgi:hypothetical protein